MAKAPTRAPVTMTGVALLAAIAASTSPAAGVMMLTQGEAGDIVSKGLAVVDTTKTDGDTAAVSLTDAGRAELAAGNGGDNTTAATSAASSFDIDDAVPMPTDTARRGRSGGYPFDKLEIGQSFHVAKSADNEDPAARLASSVSGARVKFSVPDGDKTETVTVKTYKRGEDGKYIKDADGKRVVDTETTETRPVLKLTRDFTVKSVGADDPRGEGARVWRVALAS